MIITLIILTIIATAATYWGQLNNGEIRLAPLVGIMVGALWSKMEIEDEKVTEYWLQVCIVFISITVIWEKPMTGSE